MPPLVVSSMMFGAAPPPTPTPRARTLYVGVTSNVIQVLAASDGDLLIRHKSAVSKVKFDGTIVWSHMIAAYGTVDMAEDSAGNVFVLGGYSSYVGSAYAGSEPYASLTRINADGTVAWSKNLTMMNSGYSMNDLSLRIDTDGNPLAVMSFSGVRNFKFDATTGAAITATYPQAGLYLLKLNPDGSRIVASLYANAVVIAHQSSSGVITVPAIAHYLPAASSGMRIMDACLSEDEQYAYVIFGASTSSGSGIRALYKLRVADSTLVWYISNTTLRGSSNTNTDYLDSVLEYNGHVYVSLWTGSKVIRLDPATGSVTGKKVFTTMTTGGITNVTLGNPDAKSIINALRCKLVGEYLCGAVNYSNTSTLVLFKPSIFDSTASFVVGNTTIAEATISFSQQVTTTKAAGALQVYTGLAYKTAALSSAPTGASAYATSVM